MRETTSAISDSEEESPKPSKQKVRKAPSETSIEEKLIEKGKVMDDKREQLREKYQMEVS